jgi:putative tryptophan/tyrosine transport system substrate-binding protein
VGKVYRIGMLMPVSRADSASNLEAFRQGLRDLGYVDGQSIILEPRFADGRVEPLPDLAIELVRLSSDVIVTWGTPAAQAAQRATRTIPIVMAAAADPVGTGLVASLARPGGNLTGVAKPDHRLREEESALGCVQPAAVCGRGRTHVLRHKLP